MQKTSPDEREQLLRQIDTLICNLQKLRTQLVTEPPLRASRAADLFGKLGTGSWQEYDDDADWKRFAL
jgi:hypothetical protein